MDKKEVVVKIIELVGGEENIIEFSHCFTRLRLVLKDRSKANDEAVKQLAAVMGIIDRGGEMQIVMGNGVSLYYDEAIKLLGTQKSKGSVEAEVVAREDKADSKNKKMSLVDRIAQLASAVFIPIIGGLAACGTLQGVMSLLVFLKVLSPDSGTYMVIHAISDSIFYFLPFFLAYTAANYFGGKVYISMIIAATLMYPTIMAAVTAEGTATFLGIPMLVMTYSKTVFPILAASWLASVLEKKLRKVIPDVLKMIFVPLIVLLIVVPLTLLLVGPVLTIAMKLVTTAIQTIYGITPVITGAIVGGIWQLLVFLGISKAFIPIFTEDFSTLGYSYVGAITFFVAVMGQTGAVLGIALKTKDAGTKSVATAAVISACFGITEPALFGLNIPAKKPFIIGSLSAAAGGLISPLFGGKLYSLATGILGIPSLLNPNGVVDMAFWGVILGSVVTLILATSLTYMFGWSDDRAAV